MDLPGEPHMPQTNAAEAELRWVFGVCFFVESLGMLAWAVSLVFQLLRWSFGVAGRVSLRRVCGYSLPQALM